MRGTGFQGLVKRLGFAAFLLVVAPVWALSPAETANWGAAAAGVLEPGSTEYPELGMWALNPEEPDYPENGLSTALYDPVRGHAYFTTYRQSPSLPSTILKFRLGSAEAPLTLLNSQLMLEPKMRFLFGLIDEEAGYLYYYSVSPSRGLHKYRIQDGDELPEYVGSTEPVGSTNQAMTGAFDTTGGFIYLQESGAIHKFRVGVGSSPPEHVGSLAPSGGLGSYLAHQPATGLLFGVRSSSSPSGTRVVKFTTGGPNQAPEEIETLLIAGLSSSSAKYFDAPLNTLSFHSSTFYRVDLGSAEGPMSVELAGEPTPTEIRNVGRLIPDEASGYAYGRRGGGGVVKLRMGFGTQLPELVHDEPYPSGPVALPTSSMEAAFLDTSNRILHVGLGTDPGRVASFSAPPGDTPHSALSAIAFHPGRPGITCAAIDEGDGYAYFGTDSQPAQLLKYRLDEGAGYPDLVSRAYSGGGSDDAVSIVLNEADRLAYLVSDNNRVTKFSLGDGDAAPQSAEVLSFASTTTGYFWYSNLLATSDGQVGVISGYGWEQGRVQWLKLALSPHLSGMELLGYLGTGRDAYSRPGAIDPSGEYGYYPVRDLEGKKAQLAMIRIGDSQSPMELVGQVLLSEIHAVVGTGVVDFASGFAYYPVYSHEPPNTGHIVKILINSDGQLPVVLGTAPLNLMTIYDTYSEPTPYRGHAYYFPLTQYAEDYAGSPYAHLSRHEFGTFSSTAETLQEFSMGAAYSFPRLGLIHRSANDAYVVTNNALNLTRVRLDYRHLLAGSRIEVPVGAALESMSFYSHAPSGEIRLSLYDDGEPRRLLWDSEAISNDQAPGVITIPVEDGLPAAVALEPGIYWLAWQVSDELAAPGFVQGVTADGFFAPHAFGPSPPELPSGSARLNSYLWSQWISYQPVAEHSTWIVRGAVAAPAP